MYRLPVVAAGDECSNSISTDFVPPPCICHGCIVGDGRSILIERDAHDDECAGQVPARSQARAVRLAAVACFASSFAAMAPQFAAAQGAITGNAFNPALSLILDGKYSNYSRDPADYQISGVLLGGEAGLLPEGFSLGETELAASANVDDKFYGQVTLSIGDTDEGTELNVEEAYVQTTTLPAGFTARAGKFFSDIGYQNSKHSHGWDFVDQPLVYRALLGEQFGDTGVQVKWVAPATMFVELGAEAFSGSEFPAAGAANGGTGAYSAFGHIGGDVGSESSWRAGLSYLHTDSEDRESVIAADQVVGFTGSSEVMIADAIWKWADHGNPRSRNVVLQAEYLRRKESGDLAVGSDVALYDGTQSGFYLQGAYQFMPRWRVGLRYDQLTADNTVGALPIDTPLTDDRDSSRITAMVDFSNSEFSRFRLQIADDRSRAVSDRQLILQYVFSLGAHGAHQF